MKKQSESIPDNVTTEISRRKFLKSTASGGAALVVANTISLDSVAAESTEIPEPNSPFEEVLSRCGSEFGDVRECN
jgi:peptide subunit release factor 1 (eRF1)